MKADTVELRELFAHESRLVVPLFQRPYVWKQEQNWLPLWEHVEAAAERVLRGREANPMARMHVLNLPRRA